MSRTFLALTALTAATLAWAGCSSSPSNGSPAGSGGAGATTTTTKTTTGTGGGTSSSSTTGTGGGGIDAGDAGDPCTDPGNPMLTSCIVPFLAGCWAPDLSGTCTDMNGVVSWSDGSKYVSQGAMTGIYAPGDTTPCIPMTIAAGTITAKKGSQTIVYAFDGSTMTATITCPDLSTFQATGDQVTAFNRCHGLNCP